MANQKNEGAEQVIRLILIRHGETLSNAGHRYLGRTDEPLSAVGIEKLQKLRRLQLYPPAEILFTGPMKRCRESAGILYPELVNAAGIIEEWREIDFGEFEGRTAKELTDNAAYQAFIDSGGKTPFPGGESREAFCDRSVLGFYKMLDLISGNNMPSAVAAVVHGGTVMAILSRLAGGDYFDHQLRCAEGVICSVSFKTEQVPMTADTGRYECRINIENRITLQGSEV